MEVPEPAQRAGEALAALTVVEEPRGAECQHAVPSIGLTIHDSIRRRHLPFAAELTAIPAHPEQAGVPHHVHVGALGREPGDGGLGQLQPSHQVQGDRIEGDQFARLTRLGLHADAWSRTAEVLGDERAVGKPDEAVVGPIPRQPPRGNNPQVRIEPVDVVPEDHVDGSGVVNPETARPDRTARQLGRACDDVQGSGVDGLDAADRPVAGRVAQEEEPLLVADDHGRRRSEPGRRAQPAPRLDTQPARHRLQARRTTVFGSPRQLRAPGVGSRCPTRPRSESRAGRRSDAAPRPAGSGCARVGTSCATYPFSTLRATVWRCTSSGPS